MSSSTVQLVFSFFHAKCFVNLFDSLRDFSQFSNLCFHRHYGLFSRIQDVHNAFTSETYFSPETFFLYEVGNHAPFQGLQFSTAVRSTGRDAIVRTAKELKIKRRERNWTRLDSVHGQGSSFASLDEDKKLLVHFGDLYSIFDKEIPRDSEVWLRIHCEAMDSASNDENAGRPALEMRTYDPQLERMDEPIVYYAHKQYKDVQETLPKPLTHLGVNAFSHALWVRNSDLVGAILRCNLVEKSRIKIGIKGNCLVLYALTRDGEEITHIHGRKARNNEWMTPAEQDISGIWDLQHRDEKEKDFECWNRHRKEVLDSNFQRLSNDTPVEKIAPLALNLCLKSLNILGDRVLVALGAPGTCIFIPVAGFAGPCFQRFIFPEPEQEIATQVSIPTDAWKCEPNQENLGSKVFEHFQGNTAVTHSSFCSSEREAADARDVLATSEFSAVISAGRKRGPAKKSAVAAAVATSQKSGAASAGGAARKPRGRGRRRRASYSDYSSSSEEPSSPELESDDDE